METSNGVIAEDASAGKQAEYTVIHPSLHKLRRISWDGKTFLSALSLVCIWAALLSATWAHWGDLTIDCGREMYVPEMLAQGQTLYTDLWFPYTPGAPYANALLFRAFGVHLSVLYWSGALAALACAVFLFLTSLEFGSRIAGWTTGVVVLVQSFVPGLFGFPLPYSFGAVYGCFGACIFLWLIIRAASQSKPGWMVAAGLAGSVTLLMKQEMGVACIAALALLLLARGLEKRSFRTVLIDLACLAPACLLSIAVIVWMISLRGVEFLTQENIQSWPTSYFMRRYGAAWLASTGLTVTRSALAISVDSLVIAAAVWLFFRWMLGRWGRHWWLFGATVLAIVVGLLGVHHVGKLPALLLRACFFPSAAPLLVLILVPAIAWLCWRNHFPSGLVQALLLFVFSSLFSFRILCRMLQAGYAIYYDGPVLLSFLLILTWLLRDATAPLPRRAAALVPFFGTILIAAGPLLPRYQANLQQAALTTDRGVIYTTPQKAATYRSVLDFMQQHRTPDESFLSVPEDTSLYFLAGVRCPTRVYAFVPGVLAPGKMTAEVIQEIERKKVRYLIWSNRSFPEYGVAKFGTDFDQPLGDYLRAAYRPIRNLGDQSSGNKVNGEWNAVIWERIADARVR